MTTVRDDHIVTGTDHQTLVAEHALLVAEVAERVRAVRRAAERNRWPASELKDLLDYTRSEVLRQAADEEQQLLDSATPALARLRRDHARLRLATEVLTRAATGEGRRSPRQVAALARALLAQLHDHVIAEDSLLWRTSAERRTTADR